MNTIYSSFRIEIEEITSEIKALSSEMYIEEYINIPDISVVPLQLLNLSLYHASVPRFLRKKYCVTTGLIQLGLDLHDQVNNQKEINESKIKKRQISVLAGDYLSSICYLLMAKENLIVEVRKLAYGISDITTAKMKLYDYNNEKNFVSESSIYDLIKTRESSLYIQFLDELKSGELIISWKYIIENMISFFYLSNELKAENIEFSNFSYYLLNHYSNKQEIHDLGQAKNIAEINIKKKMLYHKYNIKQKIGDMVDNTYININKHIDFFEDSVIKDVLIYILKQSNFTYQTHDVLEKI